MEAKEIKIDPRTKEGSQSILALINGCNDNGITPRELLVIAAATGPPTDQGLIRDKVNISAQAFSASVRKLVRLGLLYSAQDRQDRRKNVLTSTPKGRNTMAVIVNKVNRY